MAMLDVMSEGATLAIRETDPKPDIGSMYLLHAALTRSSINCTEGK